MKVTFHKTTEILVNNFLTTLIKHCKALKYLNWKSFWSLQRKGCILFSIECSVNTDGLANIWQTYSPFYQRCYINDIFTLFGSSDHLRSLRNYLNLCQANISFNVKNGKKNVFPLCKNQDVRMRQFYHLHLLQTSFNKVNTSLDSDLLFIFKVGMIGTLLCKGLWIGPDWTRFHIDLVKSFFQKRVFWRLFAKKLATMQAIKETLSTIVRDLLSLSLLYILPVSLQGKTHGQETYCNLLINDKESEAKGCLISDHSLNCLH